MLVTCVRRAPRRDGATCSGTPWHCRSHTPDPRAVAVSANPLRKLKRCAQCHVTRTSGLLALDSRVAAVEKTYVDNRQQNINRGAVAPHERSASPGDRDVHVPAADDC